MYYAFTPTAAGEYLIGLANFVPDTTPSFVSIGTECEGLNCLANKDFYADQTPLAVTLEANTAYHIMVDSFGGEQGPYTLTIEASCVPSCAAGTVCGDDSCGGTCGAGCLADEVCTDDQTACIALGDSCANPFVVNQLPFSATGDTGTATPLHTAPDGCAVAANESGSASKDHVYQLDAVADVDVVVSLAAQHDALLYAITGCGADESCVDFSDGIATGDEELTLSLTAGTTYYIVVDGFSNTSDQSGVYTLDIAPLANPCQANPTCECMVGECFAGLADVNVICGQLGGSPACETLILDAYATGGCGTECGGITIPNLDALCNNTECAQVAVGLELLAPGHCNACACTPQCDPNAVCGNDGCGGTCGNGCAAGELCADDALSCLAEGSGCGNPFVVDQLPYAHTADNSSYDDTGDFCQGGTGGNVYYQFTPPVDGDYLFGFDGFTNGDPSYIAVGAVCEATGGDCLGNKDFFDSPEPLVVTLTGGETYTVHVDSFGFEEGSYTLTIEAVPPPIAELKINEVDYDQPGSDTLEFIEIVNAGTTPATLSEYTLELVNGAAGNPVYGTIALGAAGATLAPGQRLVVGDQLIIATTPAGVLTVSLGANSIQNGPDGLRIVRAGVTLDAMSYEGVVPTANEGGASAGTDTGQGSLSRCPDGADTDVNADDFIKTDTPTPGLPNDCGAAPVEVTFDQVHALFVKGCGGCHSGNTSTSGAGGHAIGAGDIGIAYGASQLDSNLADLSVGARAIVRIKDGSMPLIPCNDIIGSDGGIPPTCLAQSEIDLIQKWVDDGELPPANP